MPAIPTADFWDDRAPVTLRLALATEASCDRHEDRVWGSGVTLGHARRSDR